MADTDDFLFHAANENGLDLNYDIALKTAETSNRPVMVVFTDLSGGCSPCSQLESKIFATKAFTDWSSQHVVLLRSDKNRDLTKKYNRHGISGIPSVLFLNASGAAISLAGAANSGKIKRLWRSTS